MLELQLAECGSRLDLEPEGNDGLPRAGRLGEHRAGEEVEGFLKVPIIQGGLEVLKPSGGGGSLRTYQPKKRAS